MIKCEHKVRGELARCQLLVIVMAGTECVGPCALFAGGFETPGSVGLKHLFPSRSVQVLVLMNASQPEIPLFRFLHPNQYYSRD